MLEPQAFDAFAGLVVNVIDAIENMAFFAF